MFSSQTQSLSIQQSSESKIVKDESLDHKELLYVCIMSQLLRSSVFYKVSTKVLQVCVDMNETFMTFLIILDTGLMAGCK